MNSITIGAGELKIWYNFFWMRCTLVRPHQARACSTARGEAELSCTTSDLRSHVPAMIWPRILVFTSMMLRVLNPAAFGSYGAGILYS